MEWQGVRRSELPLVLVKFKRLLASWMYGSGPQNEG